MKVSLIFLSALLTCFSSFANDTSESYFPAQELVSCKDSGKMAFEKLRLQIVRLENGQLNFRSFMLDEPQLEFSDITFENTKDFFVYYKTETPENGPLKDDDVQRYSMLLFIDKKTPSTQALHPAKIYIGHKYAEVECEILIDLI